MDELDALVAAPGHHSLLFENEHVRVLDTHIARGDITPVHTHRWPAVLYVLSGEHFVRRDADGTVLMDSRGGDGLTAGASWTAPFPPHTLENVGESPIHVVAVELKQA
jgi:quercetin dioxygenase-like cupin family protein